MSNEITPAPEVTDKNLSHDTKNLIHANATTINTEQYVNASLAPFKPEVQSILSEKIDPALVEIKPHNGIVFLPGSFYRGRLIKAFGAGGWSMVPRGPRSMRDSKMFREYALFALGQFVAEAVGEQEWIESNREMSEADAAEGCKTNAIQRCCKDLGIGIELWEPAFINLWKKNHAIQIWVENQQTHAKKLYWRRKDRPAYNAFPWVETGIHEEPPMPRRKSESQGVTIAPAAAKVVIPEPESRTIPSSDKPITQVEAEKLHVTPDETRTEVAFDDPQNRGHKVYEPVKKDDVEAAFGKVIGLNSKEGSNARGPWTLHGVHFKPEDGAPFWMNTFSKTVGAKAAKFRELQSRVYAQYKKAARGIELIDIDDSDDIPF